MKRLSTVAALTLAAWLLSGLSSETRAQTFTITLTVDENGNGTLVNSAGFFGTLPSAMMADPGPGGLQAALTYDLLNPPGLVAGDLVLLEPGTSGFISDIIRFNDSQVGPGGGLGTMVFYSDNLDGAGDLADTGFPTALYTNNVTFTEVGPEGNNGFVYTPIAGQPGFVAGAGGPVTYVIMSDVVPEPSSLILCGVGSGVVLVASYHHRRRRRST